MSSLQEQIVQYRKMANDDPENELGHFRLGRLLMEDGQDEEAVKSFRRTLALEPQFSKVYELLGRTLIKMNRREEAITLLQQGFSVAEERGDNIPRDEMVKMLTQLGEPTPISSKKAAPFVPAGGGFKCQRPGCMAGRSARQLATPPMNDEVGRRVYETTCADCWNYWLRELSIKVINEMRLDLSTERGQEVYDQIMKETLGLENH